MKIPEINIGEIIKKHLTEKGVSMTYLGEKVGTTRQNVSRLLSSDNINTDMLRRISIALDYNFFKVYSIDEPPLFIDKSETKLVFEININKKDLNNLELKKQVLEYFK